MKHYNFELAEKIDKGSFNEFLEDAKTSIAADNGPINFEFGEKAINKKFNDYTGVFEKYRILQDGNLIGFLEAFVDNDLQYINIYTSPIN